MVLNVHRNRTAYGGGGGRILLLLVLTGVCIPLDMLVDACHCSCLLMFVCLPLFDTVSLL